MKFLAMTALAILTACGARALDMGDRAPSLAGAAGWIGGELFNPAAPDGQTVAVVEFWATWCPPCRVTIPHLNTLQERFADRGVVLIGVTDEPEATVREFLDAHPVAYRIALDPERTAVDAYLEGVEGIPYAFLVDTSGVVVWHGHPLAGLESALEDLVEGRLDPARVRRQRGREEALFGALQRGDLPAVLGFLDEMIGEDRLNLELHQMKVGVLAQMDDAAGLAAQFEAMEETFRHSAGDLNNIAWMIVAPSPLPLPQRDLWRAWRMARRADEMTGGKDPSVLDTLALAAYTAGWPEKALEIQERAVAAASDADTRETLQEMLAFYRRVLDVRDRIRQEEGEAAR